MDYIRSYASPLGNITLACDGSALTGLWFDSQRFSRDTLSSSLRKSDVPVLDLTVRWLDEYFSGSEPTFLPPLNLRGTPFRQRVWHMLLTVRYGQTVTYGDLAKRISEETGVPRMSAQAVGGAVGRNPISIIVPCHRVIGADGSLTGYAGGLGVKRQLLALEGIRLP